jgi:hypothetical protein
LFSIPKQPRRRSQGTKLQRKWVEKYKVRSETKEGIMPSFVFFHHYVSPYSG